MPWVFELVTAASVFRSLKQATGTRCELFFLSRRRGPFFPFPRRWVLELGAAWVLQLKTRVSEICEPVPAKEAGCLCRTAGLIVAYCENGSVELFLLLWESNWVVFIVSLGAFKKRSLLVLQHGLAEIKKSTLSPLSL